MVKFTIDGEGAILGRLGTFVTKILLKGDSVDIVNSEKVIISGKKEVVANKISARKDMGSGGSLKGPKYIRQADRLLKRMLRGMLPRDRARGREAFKRLKCYIGPSLEEGVKPMKLTHKKPFKFSTLNEVASLLRSDGSGGKK
jgi:large subunit ribosomal protein L13